MSLNNRHSSFIIREEKRLKNIEKIYNKIKELETEQLELEKYVHSKEILECLQNILSKEQRLPHELYIIKTYIKNLKKFMSILESGNEKKDEEILSQIAKELVIETHKGNSFLMKIGEIGETFYFTLKGLLIVLIPKTFQAIMNKTEYINHLKFLYNCNERYLLEKTYNENINIFKIDRNEFEIYDSTIRVNTSNFENYLNEINTNKIIENMESEKNINKNMILKKENEYHKINIVGYFKVVELSEGNIFGEVALINDDSKRTASIYVKENSVFGTLNRKVYKSLIRDIQQKNKKDSISFIFNTQLFKNINNSEFLTKYWHFFFERNINKGDFIFKSGFQSDEIYFLREGEIKLFIPKLNYLNINKYIDYLENKKHFLNEEYEKENDVVISYVKEGEIFGMDDFIFNDKLFCSGICESQQAKFITINTNIFQNLFEKNKTLKENLKNFIQFKKEKMIQRLKEIKISFENSVEGNIKKNEKIEKNKIKKFFAEKENIIETKEAKINMLKSIQGKFSLHSNETSEKKDKNNERKNSLINNSQRLSINNSPIIKNNQLLIPLSQSPSIRKFKPKNKKDNKNNTDNNDNENQIKIFNSKDEEKKPQNLNNIKSKRRGTVKVNNSLNIQKLLNEEINIRGNNTAISNIVSQDNISQILIGGMDNTKNFKRSNNQRWNTENSGNQNSTSNKLKSKFAPSNF